MKQDFASVLAPLKLGKDLSQDQMRAAIGWFLSGEAEQGQIREFLLLVAQKGETVQELAGAAQALRDSMRPIESQKRPVVDTCGTGGDGAKTFNISTAAAIAIAACGVVVAKHGNRKITSSTGSADVLAELGLNLDAPAETIQTCLDSVGICFCFAPLFHPAMKHVGAVRRSISHPTLFNRLGPLANPALADRQVLGVGAEKLTDSMAGALQRLGTTRSIIVRGADGVDEISLSAETRVLEVTPNEIREHQWQPEDFGITRASRDALFADDPASSAKCIRQVFSGEKGPMRDVVVLNAAAGLWIADIDADLSNCARRVEQALDAGHAQRIVTELSAATQPAG